MRYIRNDLFFILITDKLLEFDKVAEEDGLETITETDNEEVADDEISEGVAGPITDDTATEDETVDNTQGSDEEGKQHHIYVILTMSFTVYSFILFFTHFSKKVKI